MKVYFDTNVIVAALIGNHVHHATSFLTLNKVVSGEIDGFISMHELAETYSTLSGTPWSSPVYPDEAMEMIQKTVISSFHLVPMDESMYVAAMERCASKRRKGGAIYDALHIEAANKAKCERIYTFNLAHFHELAPELKERIIVP